MTPVREVVHRDVIEDLWSAGYTVLPRNRHPDPFFVPPELVPHTRAYQWWHLVQDQQFIQSGWAPVPASRHDGYFMPAGHVGNIEVNGLGLFDKPKFEVDQERQAGVDKAHKLVEDWKEKNAEFSGGFKIGDETSQMPNNDRPLSFSNAGTKSLETTVGIPREMIPHMPAIFAERDRLYADIIKAWDGQSFSAEQYEIYRKYVRAADADPTLLKEPALNALLLPLAIENVRKGLVVSYKPPEEKADE